MKKVIGIVVVGLLLICSWMIFDADRFVPAFDASGLHNVSVILTKLEIIFERQPNFIARFEDSDSVFLFNKSQGPITIVAIIINNDANCSANVFKWDTDERKGFRADMPISLNHLEAVVVQGIGCNDKETTTVVNEVAIVTNHGTVTYTRK